MRLAHLAFALGLTVTLSSCTSPQPQPEVETPAAKPAAEGPDVAALQAKASGLFKAVNADMTTDKYTITPELVTLGKTLFFETRLSKNHDLSCNSCHGLDTYGVDGKPTSTGHKQQLGGRNAPTVYNAALHVAQFWDGRAADVEEQAKGPVLNPVEMAMPDAEHVMAVLKSIPGYEPMFKAAFPADADPFTYDNVGTAIGAFERTLTTPAPIDRFIAGDKAALSAAQLTGLQTFMDVGCTTCHLGAGVGGGMFQKLGKVKPYETTDMGRFDVTKNDADKMMFKVPSLRNIEKTAPYFHDGSVATLDKAISLMGEHQLGVTLSPEQIAQIQAFLTSLTGDLPTDKITPPTLPESGPNTPPADAS